MEFREKGEEVYGGLTLLLVLALGAILWSAFPGFINQNSGSFSQDLGSTQYAGISR